MAKAELPEAQSPEDASSRPDKISLIFGRRIRNGRKRPTPASSAPGS